MFLCEHGSPIDQSAYDLKLKAPAEETEILFMSGQRFGELQAETHAREEEAIEKPISLAEQRMGAVMAALRSSGVKRVLDLGCGEARILRELLKDKTFAEIVGLDVSHRALEIASQKLRLEDLPRMQKDRIRLIHGSLTYRDKHLAGYHAATVVEVIEHQDRPRLAAFERVLFEFARLKRLW